MPLHLCFLTCLYSTEPIQLFNMVNYFPIHYSTAACCCIGEYILKFYIPNNIETTVAKM